MPKTKETHNETQSYDKVQSECSEEASSSDSNFGRILRKRKVNLNRLASSISCPQVCQFQHCGIQLANDDTLEWHYEGHYAQELERLGHVRVKKNPSDFPDRQTRRQVRDMALERISRRRSRRQVTRQMGTSLSSISMLNENASNSDELTCPVCNLPVPSCEYSQHIENCLVNANPALSDHEDEDIDILDQGPVETYTWAGHTRVRATSLVEGGLRGPGFVEITQSSEDQILDIEGNDDDVEVLDEIDNDTPQYTENDLILPKPETEAEVEDLESRTSIQEALTGQKISIKSPKIVCVSRPSTPDDEKKDTIERLKEENEQLRQKSMCNICMDSYRTPLVSTVCWHVSCEECWMRALGTKKLCPQCKVIIQPKHLRKIYL